MKFYKVTTGLMTSVMTRYLSYKLNETTFPTFGKIFVFDSFLHAEHFATNTDLIFEGTAINPKKIKKVVDIAGTCIETDLNCKLFWIQKQKKKKHTMELQNPPKGSFVCDSFIPEKQFNRNGKCI